MKKHFSTIVFAIICGMFIASCGGGSVGKKLASNDFLGDLPNIVYQKHLTDSIIKADQKTAMDKLDWNKQSDWKKGEKIKQKFDAKSNEANTKFEAELEKLRPTLTGKAVPFEMEEGLGYEVTSFKVTEVTEYGSVSTELEVKITDPKEAAIMKYVNVLNVKMQEVDKDGNEIGYLRDFNVNLSGKTEGATGNYTYYSVTVRANEQKYADFAKIKFIKK